MSLYFWINILSISVPLAVSFHPRLQLHKKWKYLLSAIFVTMLPYILWDIYFTINGVWGFNEAYLSGISFFNLPLEEYLFFICIPYACVFTHEAIKELFHLKGLSEGKVKFISYFLLSLFTGVAVFSSGQLYTLFDMLFAIFILLLVFITDRKLLSEYYITFLFMLIPFFIVNGILTGTGIDNEVVWYNNSENFGIRLGTIPIEDSVYAFSLILSTLYFYRFFEAYFKEKRVPDLVQGN